MRVSELEQQLSREQQRHNSAKTDFLAKIDRLSDEVADLKVGDAMKSYINTRFLGGACIGGEAAGGGEASLKGDTGAVASGQIQPRAEQARV